jgi:hypothetical protein
MYALTVSQTASALARLEGLHTMLTLDEAIEVVTVRSRLLCSASGRKRRIYEEMLATLPPLLSAKPRTRLTAS